MGPRATENRWATCHLPSDAEPPSLSLVLGSECEGVRHLPPSSLRALLHTNSGYPATARQHCQAARGYPRDRWERSGPFPRTNVHQNLTPRSLPGPGPLLDLIPVGGPRSNDHCPPQRDFAEINSDRHPIGGRNLPDHFVHLHLDYAYYQWRPRARQQAPGLERLGLSDRVVQQPVAFHPESYR